MPESDLPDLPAFLDMLRRRLEQVRSMNFDEPGGPNTIGARRRQFATLQESYALDVSMSIRMIRRIVEADARPDLALRPLAARLLDVDPQAGSVVIGIDPETYKAGEEMLKARLFARGRLLEVKFPAEVFDSLRTASIYFENLGDLLLSGAVSSSDPASAASTFLGFPLADLPGFERVGDASEAGRILPLIREAIVAAASDPRTAGLIKVSPACRAFLVDQIPRYAIEGFDRSSPLPENLTEEDLDAFSDHELASLWLQLMKDFIAQRQSGEEGSNDE